jgi:hypothetical protein
MTGEAKQRSLPLAFGYWAVSVLKYGHDAAKEKHYAD